LNITNGYAGPIVVTSPNSNTNALFMGCLFVNLPNYWQVSSGDNIYGFNNWKEDLAGNETVISPDATGMPSSAFMRSMFAPIRTVLPSLNTPLPLGVSDVQITKVWITNATNAIHVKTGL